MASSDARRPPVHPILQLCADLPRRFSFAFIRGSSRSPSVLSVPSVVETILDHPSEHKRNDEAVDKARDPPTLKLRGASTAHDKEEIPPQTRKRHIRS